jgi:hypothetical protein
VEFTRQGISGVNRSVVLFVSVVFQVKNCVRCSGYELRPYGCRITHSDKTMRNEYSKVSVTDCSCQYSFVSCGYDHRVFREMSAVFSNKVGTHCNVTAYRDAVKLRVTDTIRSYDLSTNPMPHGVTAFSENYTMGFPVSYGNHKHPECKEGERSGRW